MSSVLVVGEKVLAAAVANTVLGYLPGYYRNCAIPDLSDNGMTVVMTDRRIVLAHVSLLLDVGSPTALPLDEVAVLAFDGPSWWSPFTEMALGLSGGDHIEFLRFTRRWNREVVAIAKGLGFHA